MGGRARRGNGATSLAAAGVTIDIVSSKATALSARLLIHGLVLRPRLSCDASRKLRGEIRARPPCAGYQKLVADSEGSHEESRAEGAKVSVPSIPSGPEPGDASFYWCFSRDGFSVTSGPHRIPGRLLRRSGTDAGTDLVISSVPA